MDRETMNHLTKDFQRLTKAQQVQHLAEQHGVTASAQRITARTPALTTPYQLHITAHATDLERMI